AHTLPHTITPLSPSSFFLNTTPPTATYTLPLHDALPILSRQGPAAALPQRGGAGGRPGALPAGRAGRGASGGAAGAGLALGPTRSEEHTSELQSLTNLVCRLLLEKKKTRPTRGASSS